MPGKLPVFFILFGAMLAPARAAVRIASMQAAPPSPQLIGTSITWSVTATDTGAGPLAFQFSVAAPGQSLAMTRDFNPGTWSGSVWTAQPFVWTPTGPEGSYEIQVIAKDFSTGQTSTRTAHFIVSPLVTGGTPVATATANPLVALFSAPACPTGSSIRVTFRENQAGSPVTNTSWNACHATATNTVEIAGMHPNTTYSMHAQTRATGPVTNGPVVKFTTGKLPAGIPFPKFTVTSPGGAGTDTAQPIILWGLSQLGMETQFRDVATDLAGKIIWFYNAPSSQPDLLTRPLAGGGMLTIQDGAAWNAATQNGQLLRQIDLAGNTVRETNTGAIQQQLLALGIADGGPCTAISAPPPVGAACLGGFHHEAIPMPGGGVALLASVEKIFPAGTQGDTSGLPVDVVGDMILVLDSNWQVAWVFNAFDHDSGAPQLDLNRPAVLGETCAANEAGCPPILLLGPSISQLAKDWLHANSIYYWQQTGDFIWSSKDQDWVMRAAYANGSGNGNILWRMGVSGDFDFNNITFDPWPWFSHQHDVSLTPSGSMILFDNGDTRVSPPPAGLGSNCQPSDCDSRGMALQFSESSMTVTPQLMSDLGVYSQADGSAQLLTNGNFFFQAPFVITGHGIQGFAIELNGVTVEGPEGYRGWRMADFYSLD